ncbi:ATP synthase subunit b 1 [Roseovarius sp. EC-HK134]|jgi:F-type H+-transporting ATPase subunit b|uniref:ATP synthase subunit b n=1 Tax=Roseovarius mucosus TaxID=215743 RepID=A0A1V0RPV1_9RHOB|nr:MULTISPECIES: F0F1 ATP synthase subunit B [Roseovarius]ARE83807.1 ATP synthase subunit b [Roseovarius mucosus]AWZ19557.1 ATP synthase F0 sector subunit b [Roseovarius sp. AK1035]EDM33731.1 H+-transporting two-sector ATPase, B/B' subunit [Roseovarius sp. TM1035]MBW4973355.1 F0F1 ATP synthase subunit B [Roseovarius mucosus]VVT13280.1 ATP synthase subunit b 1 [Roseovarius sp. EC-HK134]|tara:strand:+ start:872 stop:1432 length:561 start_codon:yes stop_codon:yes gene_type:complete
MQKMLLTMVAAVFASPALAASGPFFSLSNTNFVVLLAFLLFVGFLIYVKVPTLLGKKLDERAANIKGELDEARALREEAQTLLASYERKQKDVQAQADRIVAQAKEEANAAAEEAKEEIKASIARRMQAAEEQIASAEARAIRDVRDQAVVVAVAAARDVIAKQMTAADGNALIDAAIADVEAKLH